MIQKNSCWDYFDKKVRQYLKKYPSGGLNDVIRVMETKKDSDNYYYLLDNHTHSLGISFGVEVVGANKYRPYVVFREDKCKRSG